MKYLIKFFTLLLFIIFFASNTSANSKVKIGLVVPLSGENKDLGKSILKSVRLAVNDVDDNKIIITQFINVQYHTPIMDHDHFYLTDRKLYNKIVDYIKENF